MANGANPVTHFLAVSAQRGSLLLAVGIFGGVAFPGLAAAFHGVVAPVVVATMTLVVLRVVLLHTFVGLGGWRSLSWRSCLFARCWYGP